MSRPYFFIIASQFIDKNERKIHRRVIRDASNPFHLPDTEFRRLFRVHKEMAVYLCEELKDALQPQNSRDGLPVHIKVILKILRCTYFATFCENLMLHRITNHDNLPTIVFLLCIDKL